jgi:formylglycine-generating enzyme required for sulfatase activity
VKGADEMRKQRAILFGWFMLLMVANAETTSWKGSVPLEKGGMIRFVALHPGSFMMGAKNGCYDGLPVHEVHIEDPFWMARTEITQRQYEKMMHKNPSSSKKPLQPVENVSWYDAINFCKKLTEQERKAHRIPEGFIFTLPSEAQWEYACRAGTTGAFAGDLDHLGWYAANSGGLVQMVGRKQPNAWGLYDMHGNVWEWCLDDWHPKYVGAPTDGTAWGWGRAPERPIRGGTWYHEAIYCRSASRFHRRPEEHSRSIGFRPVLTKDR